MQCIMGACLFLIEGLESWFPLEKATKDSEIQGQIYLKYGTLISPETCDPKVFINVVEGR